MLVLKNNNPAGQLCVQAPAVITMRLSGSVITPNAEESLSAPSASRSGTSRSARLSPLLYKARQREVARA